MLFPKVDRVKYEKAPLNKVICQLRFPPNLKIDTEVPSDFQNYISEEFRNYEEKIEYQQEISVNLDMPEKNNPISRVIATKNHKFFTGDNEWLVNLTRTFLSLSTSNYALWEGFKDYLKKPFEALINFYKPPFLTRIGLRYIDIFCREELGLKEVDWSDLINTQYLGLLASDVDEVRRRINEFSSISEIGLEDGFSNIRITTKLVRNSMGQKCLLLDSDYYSSGNITIDSTLNQLDFLHEYSSRLMRNVITDRLHEAMEPKTI